MRPNHLMGALAMAAALGAATPAAGQGWNSPATYTLPEVDLSSFIAASTGVSANGHGVELGGIGSDLWRGPGDEPGVYWMITDRGPNADAPSSGKTFPVPAFTPTILKVRTVGSTIEILQALPITGVNDATFGVTGLPNLLNLTGLPAPNEAIYACDLGPLPTNPVVDNPTNPNGIDSEGLVRQRNGSFWVVEEYGPSLLRIDPNGRVVKRFFPADLLDYFPVGTPTGYAADDSTRSFPAIYGLKRKLNRGFEGLTMSPDEKTRHRAAEPAEQSDQWRRQQRPQHAHPGLRHRQRAGGG